MSIWLGSNRTVWTAQVARSSKSRLLLVFWDLPRQVWVPLCIYQPSCIFNPQQMCIVSSKGTACVLTCKSQVKTLCLALPSNFLACPSLNIDIAPQWRCLILLRVGTAQLTVGPHDIYIFLHGCVFLSLLSFGEEVGFPCLHTPQLPPSPKPPLFSPKAEHREAR